MFLPKTSHQGISQLATFDCRRVYERGEWTFIATQLPWYDSAGDRFLIRPRFVSLPRQSSGPEIAATLSSFIAGGTGVPTVAGFQTELSQVFPTCLGPPMAYGGRMWQIEKGWKGCLVILDRLDQQEMYTLARKWRPSQASERSWSQQLKSHRKGHAETLRKDLRDLESLLGWFWALGQHPRHPQDRLGSCSTNQPDQRDLESHRCLWWIQIHTRKDPT